MDVYRINNSEIEFTYDIWSLNPDGKKWEDYVVESKEKALTYIKNYDSRNKDRRDKIFYVVVPSREE